MWIWKEDLQMYEQQIKKQLENCRPSSEEYLHGKLWAVQRLLNKKPPV